MLTIAMYTTIKTLISKGMNKSEIARSTGHDWKTIQKVVQHLEKGITEPVKKPHPSTLDPYRETVLELIERGLSAVRIHEELMILGCRAKYGTVKDYVRKIKKREDVFVRIHTEPGEEAQVDFGYVGFTPDQAGKKRKTWVFNMRLSYSRLDYYETVYDQRVETFIQCHIHAFHYFKGVPKYVKIDNLKAAILEAHFYEPVYQRLYKELSEHYGFSPLPCRIYMPNDKGKVESGIKYVKRNFFSGRTFQDQTDRNKRLTNWMERTCNVRVHGTTRKIPKEVFEAEEKHCLKTLPTEAFELLNTGTRKVYHDCHIYVDYNYYSVPFEYVGREVEIKLSASLLKIYDQGKLLTLHPRRSGRGHFTTNEAHYPPYKGYSQTEFQEKYQMKMAGVGEYAEQLFLMILKRYTRTWSRPVSGILKLARDYSNNIVNLACKRGVAFGVCDYQIIKNMCQNGSYNLPCEFNFKRSA